MGLLSFLFGKKPKPEKSESGNKAYDYLMGAYSPMVSGGTGAYGATNALLGVGGDSAAQEAAFNNYLDSTGYNFIQDEAMQGLTNAFAGRGMLRSGAAGKAFQDRAANIGKTYFDNYLGHLEKQSQLGLGAGGLIGNAGQYSTGTGGTQGTSGNLGSILQLGAMIFSEPCLKENIEYVGTRPDGLDVYDFNYRRGHGLPTGRHRGVMADQVERLRPDALGPRINGYRTVDYGRLAA